MDKQLNILVIDDTKTNLDILLDILDQDYSVIPALSANAALKILEKLHIDLILLDILMPDIDGFELCKKLKNNLKTKNIPVVFITSKDDGDTIEQAYEVGGVDYITKPFKAKEVLSRIKMQVKLKKTIEDLEYISFHDQLTGIYNRRKFFELANEKFKNEKKDLYCVMIDIDKFKTINDTYGHPIGDEVLKLVSKTIDKYKPQNSILGRLGGEEFALVLNEKYENILAKIIESLREKVSSNYIDTNKNNKISVTISIGVSKYSNEFKTIDQFLQDADFALYDAKGKGRNRSIFRGIKSSKKYTALIAEDTPLMQEILANILEDIGFDIIFSSNGKEAYEKYKELNPSLVIMDLDMPIMDGEQSSLKILNYDKDAKILMVTSHCDIRMKQDILVHGVAGYITKPFHRDVIVNEINSLKIKRKEE